MQHTLVLLGDMDTICIAHTVFVIIIIIDSALKLFMHSYMHNNVREDVSLYL